MIYEFFNENSTKNYKLLNVDIQAGIVFAISPMQAF